MNRVVLAMLEITNGDMPEAIIPLAKGLNVISGVENRGKTYAFNCLDYLMGGADAPEPNLHSKGYTTATVYFTINGERRGGVRRNLVSGNAEYLPYQPLDQDVTDGKWMRLMKTHTSKSESISSFWVNAFGFEPNSLRGNMSGETKALTIRYLARFVLVDEMRIMAKESTIRSTQSTNWTADGDAFALILGARKNSPSVAASGVEAQQMSLAVRQFIIEEIERLNSQLSDIPSESTDDEAVLIARRAEEFTIAANTAADELQNALVSLGNAQLRLTEARIKAATSREIAARLVLLQEYYKADMSRLQAVSETAFLLNQLNSVPCPTCQRPFSEDTLEDAEPVTKEYLSLVMEGAKVEIGKIGRLGGDLSETLTHARADFEEALATERMWSESFDSLVAIVNTQNEQVAASRSKLSETFSKLSELAERKVLRQRQTEMAARIAEPTTDEEGSEAPPQEVRTDFDGDVVKAFCGKVQHLLEQWKWNYTSPPLAVTFDQATTDILISGYARRSFSKAVRALISSAFVIGILDYCLEKDLPHPGFVVLDSPLTTKKDRAAPIEEEEVSEDILTSFFTYLARNYKDHQIIVIDNKEPPVSLEAEINHIRFDDDSNATRQGLFPVNT